jgi:iron complex outermembrane receptor protein
MLSSSGPVTKNKKLLYRIDVGYNETDGTQDFVRSSRQEYFGALTYRFSKTTSAGVEWSKMINYASRPGQVVWLRDRASNQYVGKYTDNFYFNRSGPGGGDGVHQDWNYQSVYAYLDHRINNVFSSRIATAWWDRNSPSLAMGGRQDLYTDTTVLAGLRPTMGDIIRDNLQVQADLLAQYAFWGMGHRTLVSLTWSKESDHSWSRALPDSVWNDPSRMQQTLDVNRQSWFYPKWNFDDYSNLTRDREQITTISSLFVSHRADLFDKRVHAFVGGRFDWVDINLDDYLTGLAEKQTTDAFAPQAGINVTVTKTITAYASYSRSFTPQAQTRTRSQELYPNEEGIGIDFGFKTSFLDRRLNLTIGGFLITKDNVLQNYTNDEGIPTTDVAGRIKSDGAEIELNYQATKSLQFIGGAAWMDNRVTRNDEQPWTVGHLVARGPSPYNYGLAVIYRFKSGILNGFTLRADCKGQGHSLGEYGTGRYTRGGVTYENDNRINIKQPGFIIFNAGVSYTFKPGRGNPLRHTFSLNLKNITDREYSTGNWIPRDGFTMSFGYKLGL